MKNTPYSDFIHFDFSKILEKYIDTKYKHHAIQLVVENIKLVSSDNLECIEVTSKDHFGNRCHRYFTVDGFVDFLKELELSQKKVQYKVYFEDMNDTIGSTLTETPPIKHKFSKIYHVIKINIDGSEELYKNY